MIVIRGKLMPDEPANSKKQANIHHANEPANDPALLVDAEPSTMPTQPKASPSSRVSSTGLSTTPQKSKKKWIIGGSVAAVLALLLGVGVFAYSSYQNPDRVLNDALTNILAAKTRPTTAKGTAEYTSEKTTVSVQFNGKEAPDGKTQASADVTIKMEGAGPQTIKLSADIAADQKDKIVYFKIKGVQQAIDASVDLMVDQTAGSSMTATQKQEMAASYKKQLGQIAQKFDNQWIKADTSKQASSDGQATTCQQEALDKLSNDKATQSEIAQVYAKNRFLSIKKQLGSKNGSFGYELGVDKTKAKAFDGALKDTAFGKKAASCGSSTGFSTDTSSDSKATTTLNVWIDQWTHKFTAMDVTANMNDDSHGVLKLNSTFGYNSVGQITMPSGAKDINQVTSEIQGSFGADSTSSSTSYNSI